MSAPRYYDVLLASDHRDATAATVRDPSLATYRVVTRESQLYGLMIREYVITERAARNMPNLQRMVRYLQARSQVTRAAIARGELR